jgi:hypothetical protein
MNIKTIDIKGKQYVTVAERVRLVHAERESFEVVESAPFELAGRVLWRAVIKVNGKQYIGTAEVKLNAAKNLPDGTNPFECGETSAVGRALGLAGLGAVESIASADEVVQAIAEQEYHTPRYNHDGPATESQLTTINRLQKELGMSELASAEGLTFGDCAAMLQDLNKRLQQKRKAS